MFAMLKFECECEKRFVPQHIVKLGLKLQIVYFHFQLQYRLFGIYLRHTDGCNDHMLFDNGTSLVGKSIDWRKYRAPNGIGEIQEKGEHTHMKFMTSHNTMFSDYIGFDAEHFNSTHTHTHTSPLYVDSFIIYENQLLNSYILYFEWSLSYTHVELLTNNFFGLFFFHFQYYKYFYVEKSSNLYK